MDFSLTTLILTFGAGFASILSPCVLPVVPIIVTGREHDSKFRPVAIVTGLSITFILMGVLSSIAGSFIAGKLGILEKVSGILIIFVGILMLIDINIFKNITFFNRFYNKNSMKRGLIEGLFMGLSLGLVWIPCVGPMLSSVLAKVATVGKVDEGILLLTIYSLGFALPMLLAGYATQFFRKKISIMQRTPILLRIINGSILIIFGVYILSTGLINFGF